MDTTFEPTPEQLEKLEALRARLRELGRVGVAFSGGVDSTLLMKVAHDELGDDAVAFTGSSFSVPARELAEAQEFCSHEGIRHVVVETHEFELEGFDLNPTYRCYHCKKELFPYVGEAAGKLVIETLAEGSNLDDLGDFRPGFKAISEMQVASPLRDAQLTKNDIRALSLYLGLPTWDKPAFACLNSRFAYGDLLTPERLAMVDAAEEAVRAYGITQVRVRVQDKTARIEVPPDDIALLTKPDVRAPLVAILKSLGFDYVSLDLQGYRTGSMNETL